MKKGSYILFILTNIISSCSQEQNTFEVEFYENIEKANNENTQEFNLSKITDFNWDEFIWIKGNESVPILVKEILALVPEENEEIPINHDRFYFFLNNTLVRKMDLFNDYSSQQYDIGNCGRLKLKKSECKFRMRANTKNSKDGTVFLIPQCMELPEFMK